MRRESGARSNCEDFADGLDSELFAVLIDVVDHHRCGRSSSAAKKAEDEKAAAEKKNADDEAAKKAEDEKKALENAKREAGKKAFADLKNARGESVLVGDAAKIKF